MTANHSGAVSVRLMLYKKKAALVEDGFLSTGKESSSKLSVSTGDVKANARLHFARWLATGQSYHLRLARAKFYAAWNGAA
jgi:hypothetical protein